MWPKYFDLWTSRDSILWKRGKEWFDPTNPINQRELKICTFNLWNKWLLWPKTRVLVKHDAQFLHYMGWKVRRWFLKDKVWLNQSTELDAISRNILYGRDTLEKKKKGTKRQILHQMNNERNVRTGCLNCDVMHPDMQSWVNTYKKGENRMKNKIHHWFQHTESKREKKHRDTYTHPWQEATSVIGDDFSLTWKALLVRLVCV